MTQQEIQNTRNAAKAKVKKSILSAKIKTLIQEGFSLIAPAGGLAGADKANQLILQQISKLQDLVTGELTELATSFGITGLEDGEPSITLPPPSVPIQELNIPELPPEAGIKSTKLSLTPIEVKISELDLVSGKIQEQFLDQIRISSILEEQAKQLAQELTLKFLQGKRPPYCPVDKDLDKLLKKLNALLDVLENTTLILNITSISLNTVANLLEGAITVKEAISIAKIAFNQAVKALPLTPGPLTSILTDLQEFISQSTFKADGSPRLKETKIQVQTGAFFTAIAAAIVNQIVVLLKIFMELLKRCGKEVKPLGSETMKFISENQVRIESNTQQSYQGFTFQIIQRPLPSDPKIQRNVAQALNTEGIVALESQPSFTGNPKVLIEELKLIIDRDNLKAY
jgi:stage V sporulation protein SpoVS